MAEYGTSKIDGAAISLVREIDCTPVARRYDAAPLPGVGLRRDGALGPQHHPSRPFTAPPARRSSPASVYVVLVRTLKYCLSWALKSRRMFLKRDSLQVHPMKKQIRQTAPLRGAIVVLTTIMAAFLVAQTNIPPYVISTIAGNGLGDGGPAKQAELIRPLAVAVDASGNIYVGDSNQVRKVSAGGTISTYAGTGVVGTTGDGGPATAADLYGVAGLAVDRTGNLYISTTARIRRVSTSGIITTIAGSTAGSSGDGQLAVDAKVSSPSGLAFDGGGNLYIADGPVNCVRKITPDGRINTVAGNGTAGTPVDGATATSSPLNSPRTVAVDASGDLYIGTEGFGAVYKVDPTGIIRTVAGTGQVSFDGNGQPLFFSLTGLAVDSAGAVWVADYTNHRIRKISGGIITTVAGNGIAGFGGDGGAATASQLAHPCGIVFDQSGNLYIADQDNQRIRVIAPSGTISTIAGGAQLSAEGGPANMSALALPGSVVVDQKGNIYVSDSGNDRIRKITSDALVTTVAGTGITGFSGDGKAALLAQLNLVPQMFGLPGGVLAVDSKGDLYISDDNNFRIRMVAPDGTINTVAGNGKFGFSGDGGPATSAQFNSVFGLATDAQGQLYIGDEGNSRLRKVALDGIISTVLSNWSVWAVATDKAGNLYLIIGSTVKMLSPDGTLTTIAGYGNSSEDGIPAASAQLVDPIGLAVDGSGNLFISETMPLLPGVFPPPANAGVGHRIRMITPSGMITTIAGTGVFGFNGDGGLATSAQLASPAGIAVDSANNVYVADQLNHRIRKLTPDSKIQLKIDSGNLQSAVAGSALPNPLAVQLVSGSGAGLPNSTVNFKVASGSASLSATTATTGPDGRASVTVTLGNAPGPVTVTASASGLPPVTFTATSTSSSVPAIAAGGVITSSNFGGAALIATGDWIEIYGTKLSDTTRTWGGGDFSGTQAPASLDGVQVLVNGNPAFVQLVSPGQINAQVPDGISGGAATVVVKNSNGSSVAATVSSAVRAPALLAAPAFRSGNRQYVVALFPDNTTFVGPPGLVPGAAFQPAQAGDHIVLYGVGFGSTIPVIPAGQIAGQTNSLPNVVVKLGDVAATVEYAGLAVGSVGLYQFNIVVPTGVTGDAQLTVAVDGVSLTQALYLTLR